MNLYDKTLSDTDSIYCRGVTNSHQSSIFIAQTNNDAACYLFGNSYTSNSDVVLVLSKTNLSLNILAHYLAGDSYFKRSSSDKWDLNKQWLSEKKAALDAVFRADHERFHAQVNKETTRTYLKGITSIMPEGGSNALDLRHYLFAGDTIRFVRQNDGSLRVAVLGCGGEDVVDAVNLKQEFSNWLANIYRRANGAALNSTAISSYVRALEAATTPNENGEPCSSHGKVVWQNIYEFLYGHLAQKAVFEIEDKSEFKRLYGDLRIAVGQGPQPPSVNASSFATIRQWISGQTGGAFLPPALDRYGEFLDWRLQKKDDNAPVLEADLLSIAMKIFAEKRYEEEWQGKTNSEEHQSIYSMSDLTPEKLAEGSLDDFYNDFLLKVWVFKNGGSRKYAQLDDAEKMSYRQFVVDLNTQLKGFDAYFPPNTKCPAGMGVGMLTELMMRFWPKSCCSYNKLLIHDALVTLGMAEGDFVWPKTPSIYQDFMGKCATILRKMEQMKLPRRPEPGNDEPPDYITVNEFLWFVHEYKDLIQEEVMSKAMKPADYSTSGNQPKAKKPQVNLSNAEDVVLLRLAAALRAKPFAILAGHSGTGKSRMVRQLAYMTAAAGNHKVLFEDADGKPLKSPGNFCMVQVKPNWHDSTDLLGYYSELKDGFKGADFVKFICKAYAYPDVPFFVCLDEMNLAPVEQYFAEYLSAIESRKIDDVVILAEDGTEKTIKSVITDRLLADEVWRTKAGAQDFTGLGCEFTQSEHWLKKYGLTIPRNLFVVGTVNMDESTNQFSRKVLDRAFTLEMTDADFEHFGDKNPEPTFADFAGDEFAKALLGGEVVAKKPKAEAPQPEKDAFANQVKKLTSLQPVLDGTSFVVAYRFANEYMLYADALGKMCDVMDVSGGAAAPSGEATPNEAAAKKPEAFDDMILMKVLPRITGDTEMVMRIFAGDPGRDKEPRALDDADVGGLAKLLGKESASFGKMKEIVKRGESSGSGTLTFWP